MRAGVGGGGEMETFGGRELFNCYTYSFYILYSTNKEEKIKKSFKDFKPCFIAGGEVTKQKVGIYGGTFVGGGIMIDYLWLQLSKKTGQKS